MTRAGAAIVLASFAWYFANEATWCALTPRDWWSIDFIAAMLSGAASGLILMAIYFLFRPAESLAKPQS